MKPAQTDLLLLLAERGGGQKSVSLTTIQAAQKLGVSQQTASRWLAELLKEGLVSRTQLGLRLTPVALNKLLRFQQALKPKPGFFIEGIVTDGLRDGAYYMSQPEYKQQFRKLLGFAPFEGTLNLRLLSEEDTTARSALAEKPGLLVKAFKRAGRFFDAVKTFKCRINSAADGAVIMPVRTHHSTNVLELIAPVKLRQKLRLKNGSRVAVEVFA